MNDLHSFRREQNSAYSSAPHFSRPSSTRYCILSRAASRSTIDSRGGTSPKHVFGTAGPQNGDVWLMASKVFVGNLNFNTSREELETLFSQAGSISDVYLPTEHETGRPRGFAFHTFTH